MNVALGRVHVQLLVSMAPAQSSQTSIREARERAESRLAAHSAAVERAYRRERLREAARLELARWECDPQRLYHR